MNKNIEKLKNLKGIYLILDRKLAGERSYREIIEKTSKDGVKIVQLREKGITDRQYLETAIEIKDVCRKNNVLFIINDRIDIALASEADGVHLGQDDMPVEYARKILGNNKIIGISAGNEEELEYALNSDVDYISPGPVFPTFTKNDAGEPIGIEFVKLVISKTDKPVIPIGGIDSQNVRELSKIGINKVAVISAILKANNIETETLTLFQNLLKPFPNK